MGRPAAIDEWEPRRTQVDSANFSLGEIGPYRLGRHLRKSAHGEVYVAVTDRFDHLVELELFGEPVESSGAILSDVNHLIGLRHPHLSPVMGAGVYGEIPYVVRPLRLGRTLDQLVGRNADLKPDATVAIAFSLAAVLHYLAEEGAQPGVCSQAGFDSRDIFIGFDGNLHLLCSGFRRMSKNGQDPAFLDLLALRRLVGDMDRLSGSCISPFLADTGDFHRIEVQLRRAYREECGTRRAVLGSLIRSSFSESISEERTYFGLATLH